MLEVNFARCRRALSIQIPNAKTRWPDPLTATRNMSRWMLTDMWGRTPLDDALRAGAAAKEAANVLVASGGTIGAMENSVESLISAVHAGDLAQVQSLLKSGVPPSAADVEQRTALHHACTKGDRRIIACLIESGAKLNAVDSFGLTPLGEAARHESRTGANRIREMLVQAGATETEASDELTVRHNQMFFFVLGVLQFAFIILFMVGTEYATDTANTESSTTRLKTTYSMFMDVHVMIFIGFGFLMTFLRKYGHSSAGLNFLVGAFVIQWHLLCGGFFKQAFHLSDIVDPAQRHFVKIGISLSELLTADFASAAVLITFGALLGKVTPLQLLVLAFLEVIVFTVNENILVQIGILDVGGSIIVHLFGAYFGLAASWALSSRSAASNVNNASVYHSDLFAMIGTLFLWIYWPSFVASPAGEHDQERAIIATTLSLTGSCVAAFLTSLWLRGGRFSMVDVQNATLAGGVAIGSAANLAVLSPAESVVIGVLGGVLSVVGYTKIQPLLETTLGLHDTCGVNNLHGMPALLAGTASAIVIAYSDKPSSFASPAAHGAVYAAVLDRTAGAQAGYQFVCMLVSFSMAVAGGLGCGTLVKQLGSPPDDELFLDRQMWEVPTQEMPFFYDARGEINREIFASHSIRGGNAFTNALNDLSAHGGQQFGGRTNISGHGLKAFHPHTIEGPSRPSEGHGARTSASGAAGGASVISNELLSMKLDLVLQQIGGGASGVPTRAPQSAAEAAV